MSDTDLRALAQRLRARADIEEVPPRDPAELDAVWEDVPEVTWEEMREIVALLKEAAAALECVAASINKDGVPIK